MANRILRDWTTSEAMDSVSLEAEVFFTRLIMKADDYGSFYANPKLLKAALFPLREVSWQQIGSWVFECTEAGLIFPYEVEGKEYIRIINFKQRLRQMRNVFPHPVEGADYSPATRPPVVSDPRAGGPPDIETETKKKQETKQEREPARVFGNGVPRETKPDKLKIFEMLFTDELYIEGLAMVHRNKDIKLAFEECYIHHSNAPNPPTELHEWKQKLNTWLINTKNGTNQKTAAVNSRREAFAKRHSSDAGR